jgi:hypothetical protein
MLSHGFLHCVLLRDSEAKIVDILRKPRRAWAVDTSNFVGCEGGRILPQVQRFCGASQLGSDAAKIARAYVFWCRFARFSFVSAVNLTVVGGGSSFLKVAVGMVGGGSSFYKLLEW